MALTIGTTLGPYQIEAALGAGGMGEVYKARDTRLDRTVAIKVLPAHVASDPDLKRRFEREAKTVAALSHPHICPVFDVGSQAPSTGTGPAIDFLVMEYLDGETLAQRLEHGALPLDQALRFAIEIADALDKAHRQGIVHRDLKPGNIMLTTAGAKLLDFGLAKSSAVAMGADSALPTMSGGLTAAGAILGTLQYMAPEQLEGDDVDARTDIFAFGTTVYEMITGAKAFSGKSQASLIGSILKDEPRAIVELQPVSPPALDRVVKKCLAKDPEQRWQTTRDLHDELVWITDTGAEAVVAATPSQSQPAGRRQFASLVGTAVVASALVGLAVWGLMRPGPTAPRLPTRLTVTAPPEVEMIPPFGLALSPDGRTVVFVGSGPSGRQLYRRSLGEVDAVPIPGTGPPWVPFFSPDGEWVGYFDALGQGTQTLKKIRLDGSSYPVTLCPAPGGWRSASWGADDMIVFGSRDEGVWRVSANGGEPELIRPAESNTEDTPRWLDVLPDGRAVLGTVGRTPDVEIVVVDTATGEQAPLMAGASPRYISTGHIIYWWENALWAGPFDVDRRELTGPPVPVVEDVQMNVVANGLASFAVGGDSLVYAPGQSVGAAVSQLVWVDREGREDPIAAEPRQYRALRVSPDGQRAAVVVLNEGDEEDILIYDLARDTPTRLTFDPASDNFPVWSPDGQRVVFASTREGARNLFWKAANGTGEATRLTTSETPQFSSSWAPDGGTLVFVEQLPGTGFDLAVLPTSGDGVSELLLQTEFFEWYSEVSPDGRWIAYASNESGRNQIYVRPFPNVDEGKWQISRESGNFPVWSPDGRELFYRRLSDGAMMVVQIETDSTFSHGNPELLFDAAGFLPAGGARAFDIAPDGRFLMIRLQTGGASLVAVENWLDELTERLAGP